MAPRSYLFVPADRPERYAKALASGADAVIVDLEDAVAASAKDAARAALAAWLDGGGSGILVRINDAASPAFAADLAVAARPGIVGIVVPKAERADDLAHVHAMTRGVPLVPLIETANGIDRLREIAAVAGVERLAFGSIDLQVDLGIEGDGDELLVFRSALVLASRLAGICTAIDDAVALDADTRRARRLGFGAKLCIHPRQVAPVHAAFAPSADELTWARRVVDASEASQGGAVAVDGKMVDRPVLLRAQTLLARAR